METDRSIGQRLFDGCLMAVISGVGITVTLLVIIALQKVPIYRKNPFGMMKMAQLIGDFILLVVFFFYCSATILWVYQPTEFVDVILGYTSISLWYFRLHIEIVISFNRLCAICFPTRYHSHFSLCKTSFYIFLCVVVAGVVAAVHLFPNCHFNFSPQLENWTFSRSDRFDTLVHINLPHGCICIFTIVAVDLRTLVALVRVNKKRRTDSKFKNEFEFFVQAFISAVSLSIMTACFQYITPTLFDMGRIHAAFYTDALVWNILHASDGFFLIAINRELRRQMCKLFRGRHSHAADSKQFCPQPQKTKRLSFINVS